ncbi:MAG: F0F1 ATP synthase subunit delta [Proteobacteria bacterium]|nr:F0F1 ATP synthase subunit delta [Pseudomonadota bacterium]
MNNKTSREIIGRSYAEALSHKVSFLGELDVIAHKISELTPLLSQAQLVWESPTISTSEKLTFLMEIMTCIRDNDRHHQGLFQAFFGVILVNGRMSYLPEINTELQRLLAIKKGESSASLVLAQETPKQVVAQIKETSEQVFASKLKWHITLDSSLIAGFKISVGNRCFDGSLKSRLNILKHHLSG